MVRLVLLIVALAACDFGASAANIRAATTGPKGSAQTAAGGAPLVAAAAPAPLVAAEGFAVGDEVDLNIGGGFKSGGIIHAVLGGGKYKVRGVEGFHWDAQNAYTVDDMARLRRHVVGAPPPPPPPAAALGGAAPRVDFHHGPCGPSNKCPRGRPKCCGGTDFVETNRVCKAACVGQHPHGYPLIPDGNAPDPAPNCAGRDCACALQDAANEYSYNTCPTRNDEDVVCCVNPAGTTSVCTLAGNGCKTGYKELGKAKTGHLVSGTRTRRWVGLIGVGADRKCKFMVYSMDSQCVLGVSACLPPHPLLHRLVIAAR